MYKTQTIHLVRKGKKRRTLEITKVEESLCQKKDYSCAKDKGEKAIRVYAKQSDALIAI